MTEKEGERNKEQYEKTNFSSSQIEWEYTLVVIALAFHVGDPGSNPGSAYYFFCFIFNKELSPLRRARPSGIRMGHMV